MITCNQPRPAALLATATLALLALLSPLAPAPASSAADSPAKKDTLAFERAAHLRLGVNLSHWFSAEKDYSLQKLRNRVTIDDLRLISKLGLDHVRLPVDAPPLYAWLRKDADGLAFMGEIDKAVKNANQLGLAVIIDIHPSDEFKKQLEKGGMQGEPLKKFATLWEALATHFANTDPKLVFFEILNEPHITNQDFNWNMHALVAAKIRAAAPNHTIIASPGSRLADISGMLAITKLLPLPNIIYTFHNYKPDAFTHQGAGWSTWAPERKEFRMVPYPSTPENVLPAIEKVTSAKAKSVLKKYGEERWDAARIDRDVFTPARKWSERNGVPVYVGEFGVLGNPGRVDPAMRAQCINDMRVAIQKNNLNGALWDYQTPFGIVKKTQGGKAVPDPLVVKALGLKASEE